LRQRDQEPRHQPQLRRRLRILRRRGRGQLGTGAGDDGGRPGGSAPRRAAGAGAAQRDRALARGRGRRVAHRRLRLALLVLNFAEDGERGYAEAMKVDGKPYRSIWVEADGWSVGIIDQTLLPHRFATLRLTTLDDAARAIASMVVRGAPLIGAAAAYGVCLALRADASDEGLERAYATLLATRPTAINLKWALDEMAATVRNRPRAERAAAAYQRAAEIAEEDVATNTAIGQYGLPLIESIARKKKSGERVNVLTHCN